MMSMSTPARETFSAAASTAPAPAALVQQRAAGIDADGADVVVEAGEEELRVRRRFLAGTLDARNREAGLRLQGRVKPLRHRTRVVEPRLAARNPESRACIL